MERLTERTAGITGLVECSDKCDQKASGCDCVRIRSALRHLHNYEDTGLEPVEIEQLKAVSLNTSEITALNGVSVKHISDLLDAEEQGRLVVLPCKVGDTVWLTKEAVCKTNCPNIRCSCCPNEYIDGMEAPFNYSYIDDFGKTVFLTREAAEAALRKEQA